MTFRQFVLVTHRWMGLSTSLVLAVAGATGVFILYGSDIESLGFPRRVAGKLHESLALGSFGHWIVVASTAASVLLQFGGAVLWWRTKRFAVERGRGWRRFCIDLHHLVGILSAPLMFVMAVTALAMAFHVAAGNPELARGIMRFHAGRFPFPVHVLYALASFGFVLQGVTGVVMWWSGTNVWPIRENKIRR